MSYSLSNQSDQSLLAMLLGGEIAQQLAGISLSALFGLTVENGRAVCDSEARFVANPVLGAAKELFARALHESLEQRTVLSSPALVREYLMARMAHLPHEVFGVLLLDAQRRLIRYDELFRGTLTQAAVYPREVVKHALAYNAAAVIFAHNHPSGVAEPSRADEALTDALKQALGLVDVKVLDHFIVAGTWALSFSERGLL